MKDSAKNSMGKYYLPGTQWVRVEGRVEYIFFQDTFCVISSDLSFKKVETYPYSVSGTTVTFDSYIGFYAIFNNENELTVFYQDSKFGVLKKSQ